METIISNNKTKTNPMLVISNTFEQVTNHINRQNLGLIAVLLFLTAVTQKSMAQHKKTIAVISIDTKNITFDAKTISDMVQLELEKTGVFEVLDKYDVSDMIKKNQIDVQASFGKNSLISVGKLLNADKMLSGSIEKFGDKLILILRLVDVQAGVIEKTDVMEYINQQDQLQTMIRLSINNIIGVANDKLLVDLLANYDQPITTSRTSLKLSGPRVGANMTFGKTSERMQAPASEGGFEMFPVSSMIGYQFEKQYLSSGDFQALFELIPSINSLESGMAIPALTGMLGFRFNKSGIEFGLGPNFRVVKTAEGYYDSNNKWQIGTPPEGSSYPMVTELDKRGDAGITTGMIFALGKTFRSGYLNLPLNLYYSPRKSGSILGLTIGFNVAKKPKFFSK
jgi:TolB-like protein